MLESQGFAAALHNPRVHTAPLSQCRWVRDWSSAGCGFIAQIALQRTRVGRCSNAHSYLWESSNAHSITTPTFAVLSFDASNRFLLEVASVLQVPISQAVEQPWQFLWSKVGGEHFQGKNSFTQVFPHQPRWRRQEWRTLPATENAQKHHSSKVDNYWNCACEKPAAELAFWSQAPLLQVQVANAEDRETIAKTDVWSEISEISTKFSYMQWCTRCRIGKTKTIF